MADPQKLEFGSPEWRTHLRRSLAQRKRYGENITDIEGLISYIEKKDPAKAGSNDRRSHSHPKRETAKRHDTLSTSGVKKKVANTSQVQDVNGLSFYPAPTIIKTR